MTVLNHDSDPLTIIPVRGRALRHRIATTALACTMCLVPLAACGTSGT
ncbi:hypothetical protein [Bifidobacterium cuniculi]|uniref:Uncharacterized protein n=1 Tax=Bifidobacterium cuniculi TaxID=1688 RepID=A0A087AVZ5_9BIFI|nr:hypothetical protein [Bifidobacterium cuniculi]KFI62945.1 hypothetical protein BCUN_0776 [Bifidobacterium cuniculi]